MTTGRPNDMLVQAETQAHRARLKVFEEHVDDPVGRRLLCRLANDVQFRSLLELELNGCTSFQGGQQLLGKELAFRTSFKARTTRFRGHQCHGLEISSFGTALLFEEQYGLEENRWLEYLRRAVLGYACMDEGKGICSTREFIETSLEIEDIEILKRCVDPASGAYQFPETGALSGRIDPKARASASVWWSSVPVTERSCEIIVLGER